MGIVISQLYKNKNIIKYKSSMETKMTSFAELAKQKKVFQHFKLFWWDYFNKTGDRSELNGSKNVSLSKIPEWETIWDKKETFLYVNYAGAHLSFENKDEPYAFFIFDSKLPVLSFLQQVSTIVPDSIKFPITGDIIDLDRTLTWEEGVLIAEMWIDTVAKELEFTERTLRAMIQQYNVMIRINAAPERLKVLGERISEMSELLDCIQ